jgi:hypothetical protein
VNVARSVELRAVSALNAERSSRLSAGTERYFERVAKYIPVEGVAAYIVFWNLAPFPEDPHGWPGYLHYTAFLVLVAVNAFYLSRAGGHVPKKRQQIAISSLAFLVWTYAIGGQMFDQLESDLNRDLNDPYLGAALLVVALLGLGLYHPSTSSNGPSRLDLGHT